MDRRGWALVLAMTAAIAGCGSGPAAEEVLVAGTSHLGPEWTVMRPGPALRANHPRSELLVELQQVYVNGLGPPRLASDGAPVSVEVDLVGPGGRRLRLDRTEMVAYNNRVVLSVSARDPDYAEADRPFAEVAIRASVPLNSSQILWVSYDPRDYSSGVFWPSAFR